MRRAVAICLLFAVLVAVIGCAKTEQAREEQPKRYEAPKREEVRAKVYVGSVNSNIYHYPNCRWAKKIKSHNEVWFSSMADAKSKGYRACKVCRP